MSQKALDKGKKNPGCLSRQRPVNGVTWVDSFVEVISLSNKDQVREVGKD